MSSICSDFGLGGNCASSRSMEIAGSLNGTIHRYVDVDTSRPRLSMQWFLGE